MTIAPLYQAGRAVDLMHRTDLAHTVEARALVEGGVVGKVLIDVSSAQ